MACRQSGERSVPPLRYVGHFLTGVQRDLEVLIA